MNLFENILAKAKTNFANPDPTQNLQFKALQGAANLYTGVAEEAAMGGQREFERRKEVARQFLSQKGYTPDVIDNTLSQIEYKPSFMGRVREGLGNRMLETAKTTDTLSNVQNPLQRLGVGTLAYGGDVVATAMEPVASAISPIVQTGIEKAGLTPTVQNLGQQFQGFKERNPLTGEAIEGVANVSQLAPVPLGKPLAKVATQGGKAIVKTAEAVAPRVVQGVKKITPTLPKAEELLINQLEKTNRMNPTKYGEFEQMAGQRAGKFLADRKITGDAETNVAKLYENFTKSKAEADKGLGAIEKTYKPSEVPPAFNDMLGELEKRFTYTKDSANLAKVQEFKTKLQNGTLSHNDINGTKRLYEQKVKVNYIKDQNSLEVERATNIDNDVRTWQFDEAEKLGFGNLKEINKETQLNRYLADNIGDKIARGAGLNNISLTDWIIAGQIPATPQAFALYAGKKFAEKAIPKLYQKGLEKLSKIPKKEAPVADIENINKMESIRKSVTPQYDTNRLLVPPRNSSRAPATITPDVTLPKGEKATPTTKSTVIKSDITSKSKIVRPGTKPIVSPKKPVEKTVIKPTEKKVETNITRNEAIEKGFSDSAKARWNKGDFTMKERGEAIKYLKSNYKGKEYTIDGKKYKVDAIDNRNEQVRLVDNEGNIIRVKINKLPETKVTDKDIFDYYNGRVQKGYKTILSPQKTVKPKNLTEGKQSATMGDMETIPKELKNIIDSTSLEDLKKGITIKMSPEDLYKYQDTKVMNSRIADGEISSSIRNNGYYTDSPVSLVISSDGKIIQLIDGNGRVTASKEIGIKQIPVTLKISNWDSNILRKNFGQREINVDSIDISKIKSSDYLKPKPLSPQKTVKPKK